jgi:hypothetical protein
MESALYFPPPLGDVGWGNDRSGELRPIGLEDHPKETGLSPYGTKTTPQTPRVFPGLVLRLTASARRCE